MIKIKNPNQHQECAYIVSPGVPGIKKYDHLKILSFRAELEPIPIIELIYCYCDKDGNRMTGTTYQHSLREDDALLFLDKTVFDKFAGHLETISVATSKAENRAQLKNPISACSIECEEIDE